MQNVHLVHCTVTTSTNIKKLSKYDEGFFDILRFEVSMILTSLTIIKGAGIPWLWFNRFLLLCVFC